MSELSAAKSLISSLEADVRRLDALNQPGQSVIAEFTDFRGSPFMLSSIEDVGAGIIRFNCIDKLKSPVTVYQHVSRLSVLLSRGPYFTAERPLGFSQSDS